MNLSIHYSQCLLLAHSSTCLDFPILDDLKLKVTNSSWLPSSNRWKPVCIEIKKDRPTKGKWVARLNLKSGPRQVSKLMFLSTGIFIAAEKVSTLCCQKVCFHSKIFSFRKEKKEQQPNLSFWPFFLVGYERDSCRKKS